MSARTGKFLNIRLTLPQPWLWLALLICTVVAGLYPVGYRLIRAVMKVIRVRTPAKNTWFQTPVHILRWTELQP